MHIDLKKTKYYFLTCNNETRRAHFLQTFSDLDITEVHPIIGIEKTRSGVTGFSRILDLAIQNQDPTKPFQPFGIFEDDVTKYREFPESVDIPDEADWLFLGLSYYGVNDWATHCHDLFYQNCTENHDIVRMFNMLSLHGLMICSIRGLLALQKCMMESYFTGMIWDIYTGQIQPHYNVYAFRIPLVYQLGEIGGQEHATKIELPEKDRPDIPNHWINRSNASIVTCLEKIYNEKYNK